MVLAQKGRDLSEGVLTGCGSWSTGETRAAMLLRSHATEEPQGAGTVGAEQGAGYPCVMEGQCEYGRIFRSSSGEVDDPFWGLSSRWSILGALEVHSTPMVLSGISS